MAGATEGWRAPTEPSRQSKQLDKEVQRRFDFSFHAATLRFHIECDECGRMRFLYSKKRLTDEQLSVLEAYTDDATYVCGAPLFPSVEGMDPHVLSNVVFVRSALVRGMPLEKQGVTSQKYPKMCMWCCESEETKLVDLETLDLRGKNGYPICKSCHDDGHSVVTYGTAKKTGGQAQPKKASKRRAAKGGDDAEEDDDAEDDEDEDEEEDEEEEEEEEEAAGDGGVSQDDEDEVRGEGDDDDDDEDEGDGAPGECSARLM